MTLAEARALFFVAALLIILMGLYITSKLTRRRTNKRYPIK